MQEQQIQTDDEKQLKLLSIFHYITGAVAGLFACFPILHLVVGIVVLTKPEMLGSQVPPPAFGWMFVIMAGIFILLGWIYAIGLIVAGKFLVRRKHHLFCMIIAGFSCLFFPLGTALGVFTLVVLLRPSVKELFEKGGLA